jgi:Protein of unknown function (DUF3606)
MAGKSTHSGRHDLTRVRVDDGEEVQYWMMVFSCSRQELLHAVGAVGSVPAVVEAYLADKKASKDDNSFSWH